jgi:hypothetical protein
MSMNALPCPFFYLKLYRFLPQETTGFYHIRPKTRQMKKTPLAKNTLSSYHLRAMKKITSDKVEDGMILGREVCGASGNILLNKGTTLTSAMGRRLTNWGISTVYIEGEEEAVAAETTIRLTPQEVKSNLMKKFSNCDEHPLMKKLFVAVYQYTVQSNKK